MPSLDDRPRKISKSDLDPRRKIYRIRVEDRRRLANLLDNWDFLARMLLEICYSKIPVNLPENMDLETLLDYSLQINMKNPLLINMNCVALCKCEKGIYVASNGVRITRESIQLLRNLVSEVSPGLSYLLNSPFRLVDIANIAMHAEMRILSALRNENVLKENLFMGVSKPCCWRCAKELENACVRYSAWHDDNTETWKGSGSVTITDL